MTSIKKGCQTNLGGRPQAIDPDTKTIKTVEGLGRIQATTRECAAVLGVSHQTFIATMQRHPELAEALERGRQAGKTSLRRTQFRLAEKNYAFKFQIDDKVTPTGEGSIEYNRGLITGPLRSNGAPEDFATETFTGGFTQQPFWVPAT